MLAVLAEGMSGAALYFISISRDMLLGTYSLGEKNGTGTFALSRQGTRFALLHGDRQLEVNDVPGNQPPVFVTLKEDARESILRLWVGRVSWSASSIPGKRDAFGLNA